MRELNGDYLNTNLNANTYWCNRENNQKTGVYDYTKGDGSPENPYIFG